MFVRLGPWCHDHRRLVVVVWLIVLVGANAVAGAVGDDYRADFSPPGAESTAGFDTLKAEFGGQGTGYTGTIVFRAEQGVDDPEVQRSMEALFADVAEMDGVERVESPYAAGGEQQIAAQGPDAGKIAYANVELPDDIENPVANDISHAIRDRAPDIDGLEVERGGFIFADFEEPNSEVVGIAFAIIILIVAFGSVLAMGLPIGVALFGIGVGSAFVTLFSHLMQVPDFAPFVGIMIGLGVGIDYALLIVTRHREQRHAGHSVRDSVGIAMDTAGRAVVFAGVTVVISLLGMLLMGVGFVAGLAVTAAATVGFTVLAAVTLLPAFLGFAGDNLERTRRRGLIAAGFVAVALIGVGLNITPLLIGLPVAAVVLVAGFFVPRLKEEVLHRRTQASSRDVRLPVEPRHPGTSRGRSRSAPQRCSSCSSIPVLSLRLGFSDESNYAEDTTTKQAYDLLVDGFGVGSTGPLFLVASDRRRRACAVGGRDRGGQRRSVGGRGARAGAERVGHRRSMAGGADDGTPGRGDQRPGQPAPRRRAPTRRAGHRRRGPGDRVRRCLERLRRPAGEPHALLLRRRAGPVVPLPHGRVPVAAGAAQGGDHEPAVDRRGVRRRRRHVPVGLARRRRPAWLRARSRRGRR